MDRKVYEFIAKNSGNEIIERRKCKISGEDFPIYQGEKDLLEQISPIIGGEKFLLDLPTCCYRVRMLQRQLFRNERQFYHVPCVNTGKKEISIVHNSVRDIIGVKDRLETDFLTYGIGYSGDFIEDTKKLFSKVPYLPRYTINPENSEYCNQALNEKNCYLCAGGGSSENCLYTTYDVNAKYAIDCFAALNSEIVYESIHVFGCMRSFFSYYLLNCFNIRFSYDLKNCKNVLFGFGLDGVEYVFKNKKYEKDERDTIFQSYKDKLRSIKGLQEVMQEYESFVATFPHKYAQITNAENSFGTQINNSKDVLFGFTTDDVHNGWYCTTGWATNVIDLDSASRSELIYNCVGSTNMHGCISIASNFGEMRDSYYNFYTTGGDNLFGCFGLNNKSYCILNKEYPKEEREDISKKIITELKSKGKRGEFFDMDCSPFPYNDTVANRVFPIKQVKTGDTINVVNPEGMGTVEVLHPEEFISDALLDLGGEEKLRIKRRTKEIELNIPENVPVIHTQDLPDNIDDVDDSILDKIIICPDSGRPFKLIKLELDFYRQYGIALPTRHYDVREAKKYRIIPTRFLNLRTCDKCSKEMVAENRRQQNYKIYCEECYNKEIYG